MRLNIHTHTRQAVHAARLTAGRTKVAVLREKRGRNTGEETKKSEQAETQWEKTVAILCVVLANISPPTHTYLEGCLIGVVRLCRGSSVTWWWCDPSAVP